MLKISVFLDKFSTIELKEGQRIDLWYYLIEIP